jgi:hypothetical protein
MSDTKACTRCHVVKPVSLFPWCKDPRLKAGGRVGSQCKDCLNDKAKAWQRENYDRAFSTQKQWRDENRERWNAYMRAPALRYVNAKEKQTPPWADLAKIQAVYEEAAAIRALGVECEVDHIVPLQGKTARGLHVHYNLRIVLKSDNAKKRNTVDADAYQVPHA